LSWSPERWGFWKRKGGGWCDLRGARRRGPWRGRPPEHRRHGRPWMRQGWRLVRVSPFSPLADLATVLDANFFFYCTFF
jgi:hypothetical protein